MRHCYFARQIVFRDDDARGPARGPWQRLQCVFPFADRVEIHRSEPFGLLAKAIRVDRLDLVHAPLRFERIAAGSVRRHARHHLHELISIVLGLEDPLQGVAADAAT